MRSQLAKHYWQTVSWAETNVQRRKQRKLRWAKIPYASTIGSLMYEMILNRPNFEYVVKMVNRFMTNPCKENWVAGKWIFRYLRDTSSICLVYDLGNPVLEGFTNSNTSPNVDTNWSTSGYEITYAGGTISWQSSCRRLWPCQPQRQSTWPQ